MKSYGYQSEAHEVETKDGYVLRMYRILPSNRTETYPIFLQHGILHTSGAFLISGRNSAAFYLADNGFEVWLGNSRGSNTCLKHKKMSIENPKFWDYSFHEIGIYDLPAMIDYVLETSRARKVVFVGHSEAGSAAAVLLSTYPKYNKIFMQTHLVSPAIFMENFPNTAVKNFVLWPFMELVKNFRNFDQVVNNFVLKSVWLGFHRVYGLCREKTGYCEILTDMMCGSNINGSLSDWPNAFKYHNQILISDTISLKKFLHFMQLIFKKKFRAFDYGQGNFQKYGEPQPPDYDLKKITSPTYIYVAERDGLVSVKDLVNLKNVLPNVKRYKLLKNYNHCDIVFGDRVREDYYDQILESIRNEK